MCPSMAWHNARSAPESDMCPQPSNRSEASAWERRPTKRSSSGRSTSPGACASSAAVMSLNDSAPILARSHGDRDAAGRPAPYHHASPLLLGHSV